MNLKKIGKILMSKSVGTGPSSYEKRIYQAAVSQRLKNTDVKHVLGIIGEYTVELLCQMLVLADS